MMGDRPYVKSRKVEVLSPRGLALSDVNERLFAAADRVLARDGPAGLTTRAVTDEAHCAKGILHNHFGDFDRFLAAFVLERIAEVTSRAQRLLDLAGTASVIDNLTSICRSLLDGPALRVANLVLSRPSLHAEVQASLATHGSPFHDIERVLATYLNAERERGRLAPDADTSTLAFALFASVHHLLFATHATGPPETRAVRRIVVTLLRGLVTSSGPGGRQGASAL